MKTLTVGGLEKLQRGNRGINLINVLDREEFEKAHIPGSINIPGNRNDFVEQVERRVSSRDEPVVVYCASVDCQASPKAAKRLESAGFTDVYDFEGGIRGWRDAGQPVEHRL